MKLCCISSRSYSIVTFSHSKGQSYGFASMRGSSYKNVPRAWGESKQILLRRKRKTAVSPFLHNLKILII